VEGADWELDSTAKGRVESCLEKEGEEEGG